MTAVMITIESDKAHPGESTIDCQVHVMAGATDEEKEWANRIARGIRIALEKGGGQGEPI